MFGCIIRMSLGTNMLGVSSVLGLASISTGMLFFSLESYYHVHPFKMHAPDRASNGASISSLHE